MNIYSPAWDISLDKPEKLLAAIAHEAIHATELINQARSIGVEKTCDLHEGYNCPENLEDAPQYMYGKYWKILFKTMGKIPKSDPNWKKCENQAIESYTDQISDIEYMEKGTEIRARSFQNRLYTVLTK